MRIRLSDGTMERDPFDVLEEIRWSLLEANDDRADRWERLQRLGAALDLADELREVVERRIQREAMALHLSGLRGPVGEEEDDADLGPLPFS